MGASHDFLPALGVAFAMWCAMMGVMMLPATVPWLVALNRVTGGAPSTRVWRSGLFLGGYGAVWVAYALVAAALQVGLQRGGLLWSGAAATPVLAGGVLVGAGLFQLSALKGACLTWCRSPLSYFLARWRDGPAGAFRMGAGHGRHCVGCCWAIMAAGFALGVMNPVWMAALTGIILVEKLLPWGPLVGRGVGMLGIAAGLWMIVTGQGG